MTVFDCPTNLYGLRYQHRVKYYILFTAILLFTIILLFGGQQNLVDFDFVIFFTVCLRRVLISNYIFPDSFRSTLFVYAVLPVSRRVNCFQRKVYTCPIRLLLHYNETVSERGWTRMCGRGPAGKVKVVAD